MPPNLLPHLLQAAPLADWFESSLLRTVGGVLGALPLFSGNSQYSSGQSESQWSRLFPLSSQPSGSCRKGGEGRGGFFSLPTAPPQRSGCALPRPAVSLVLVQPSCPEADAGSGLLATVDKRPLLLCQAATLPPGKEKSCSLDCSAGAVPTPKRSTNRVPDEMESRA